MFTCGLFNFGSWSVCHNHNHVRIPLLGLLLCLVCLSCVSGTLDSLGPIPVIFAHFPVSRFCAKQFMLYVFTHLRDGLRLALCTGRSSYHFGRVGLGISD